MDDCYLSFICIYTLRGFYKFYYKKAVKERNISNWNKIYKCGIIPIICTVLVMGYGYWNVGNVVETDYTIYTDKNIREEGYRIAMIADLHYGTTMDSEKLMEYSKEIELAQPDMVVLCGDIVDERTTLSQIKEAIPILASIQSRYGTFYKL